MLEIRTADDGRVHLSGRFDASQVEKARVAMDPITRSVVVDVGELDYISSAGIGFLIASHMRLHRSGETLKLVNMSPRIRNIFRLAGLDRVLAIE